MYSHIVSFLILLALVFGALLAVTPVQAATFTVTSNLDMVDTQPGDGVCATSLANCTLRAAIQEANLSAGPDTIVLPADTYTLTRTVNPGSNDVVGGDLDVAGDLTINGAGEATTIIQAGLTTDAGIDRVLEVVSGNVTVRDLTIRHGNSLPNTNALDQDGGGIRNQATLTLTNVTVALSSGRLGGGIANAGTLTIDNSTVTENTALVDNNRSDSGGGIYNAGTLTVTNTQITANRADIGGGITNVTSINTSYRVDIDNSTIADNEARASAGGISNGDVMTITNSTISNNDSGNNGGGVFNQGDFTIINATLSGNTASRSGGGIAHFASNIFENTLTLTNTTIVSNTANVSTFGGDGGGVFAGPNTSIAANNTLMANNSNADGQFSDCSGELVVSGVNLLETQTGCTLSGDTSTLISNEDPRVASLADNGGPTLTHLLLDGSPAIDAGDSTNYPATDQRGVERPQDGDDDGMVGCDIGAVEIADPTPPTPMPTSTPSLGPLPTMTPPTVMPTPTPDPVPPSGPDGAQRVYLPLLVR
ncbi:MAG: choice-of-anchor Q domain-containing protein [Chloroflexota bacterium]